MRVVFRICVLVSLLVASSCSRNKGKREVAVGIAIPSYVHAVAWIAKDQGSFKEAGIQARVDVMGGSAATARSLLAESTDIGLMGGDSVIKANAAGGDLVIVAGLVNRFYHRLVGQMEIKSMADLRGKKIGLPFLGGPQDMAVRYALRASDLEYGKDVEILNLGREMNRMAALAKGDIDATMSQTPPARLEELGLRVLEDLPAREVHFPYMMVVVTRSYLKKHPDLVRSALLGLCRASDFYRVEADASLTLIGSYMQGSDTKEAALARYQTSGPGLFSWPPEPKMSGLRLVMDFLGPEKTRGIELESLVDLTLLNELRSQSECGGP